MKKKFQLTAISVLLCALPAGCSSQQAQEEGKSASEIIDTYVDTLTTAPEKARSAAQKARSLNEAEMKALKELDR
ncbi:MAG TPA: hypothetical protein ENJ37_07300 [Deltaproteobacteria bacterium]|nr:hypothetical protein [Deltaproteobacteria bacterium]